MQRDTLAMISDTTPFNRRGSLYEIFPKLKLLTDTVLPSYSREHGERVWRGQGVMDRSNQNNESSSGHSWCQVAAIR